MNYALKKIKSDNLTKIENVAIFVQALCDTNNMYTPVNTNN